MIDLALTLNKSTVDSRLSIKGPFTEVSGYVFVPFDIFEVFKKTRLYPN